MAQIDQILNRLDRLPAIPVAVTQLISNLCSSSDDPDKESTAHIVMRDSALTASVLKAANSATAGFSVPAVCVQEALQRVGENHLLKIALAHASQQALGGEIAEYGLGSGEAWLGALVGALAAEEISKYTRKGDPNVAFTAGLLRDIGKLAMGLVVDPAKIGTLLSESIEDITSRERAEWGFDHAQVGAALGRVWGLPDELLNGIRFHHTPPSDDMAEDLYDIVHCADNMALTLGYGVGIDGLKYSINLESRENLSLNRAAFEDILVSVRLRMNNFLDDTQGQAA
ncbi:MAG: HDOD domain-containing protein [Planctomycetota bacterium]|nr:HDOD domain-containing protein [Planctomycetota bacterium]MDG2144143.1 HDOD domain-containing protein [Planctomycetota bacterium]